MTFSPVLSVAKSFIPGSIVQHDPRCILARQHLQLAGGLLPEPAYEGEHTGVDLGLTHFAVLSTVLSVVFCLFRYWAILLAQVSIHF